MSSDDTLPKHEESQNPASAVESPADVQPEHDSESSTQPPPPQATAEPVPEAATPVETPSSAEASSEEAVVAETPQPVAESTEPSAAPSEETTEETAPSDPPRRQIRLNPTLGSGDSEVKAVPSIGSSLTAASQVATETTVRTTAPAPPTTGESTTETTGQVSPGEPSGESPPVDASEPQAPPRVAKPAIELPPAVGDLDAQIEAEIEAALAGGELEAIGSVDQAAAAESGKEVVNEETLEIGQQLSGKIQSMHGENVFLDLGCRSPGIVPKRQFVSGKRPEVGQVIAVVVDQIDQDEGLILVNLPKGMRKAAGSWDSLSRGQTVECMVTRANKGGLEVTISNLRGFLPASQVELGFVSDLESYVGQKLEVQISEVNQRKRNLVVSRRAHLEVERKQLAEELWKTLSVGQTVSGQVKTIKSYGAFVDIGGADGFVHIGEISWSRIRHPSEVIQEGQQVELKVLSLEPESKKISLGMKQLSQDPWTTVTERFEVGKPVSGTVTRTAEFGAFVQLEPSIEGLVHISELDYKRVNRVADVLKVGQQVEVQVLEVNPERKRISLSLKALMQKPEDKKSAEKGTIAEPEPYQRQHKGPLKGGTGTGSEGSGMFGNPGDFG